MNNDKIQLPSIQDMLYYTPIPFKNEEIKRPTLRYIEDYQYRPSSSADHTTTKIEHILSRPIRRRSESDSQARPLSVIDRHVPCMFHHHHRRTASENPKDITAHYHQQVSTHNNKYKCDQCLKTFSRPSSLRIHTLSHTGEKPHACPEPGCGRRFSVQSNMRRHLKVHYCSSISR
ncbi:MAG: hypothetical protein EXX96DRAFT_556995 [Benjaminiella poitrasii]|nr:MAG: hypothetical protein EXX96DRAFT_556995 [Benjaminiella poitrasii]